MKYTLLLSAFFYLFTLLTVNGEGEPSIEADSECEVRLSMDRSLIQFEAMDFGVQLFATNSYCYKCSKSLIASENGNCAILFTPHEWSLYAISNQTQEILASKEYTFGEHGEYIVSYDGGSISISEEKSPIDSYTPLYIVTGLIIALIIVTFAKPVYEAIKEYRDTPRLSEDPRLSLRSNPYSSNQPLLRDSDHRSSAGASGTVAGDGETGGAGTGDSTAKKSPRVMSLDTFRGFTLFCMIFVNYGKTCQ